MALTLNQEVACASECVNDFSGLQGFSALSDIEQKLFYHGFYDQLNRRIWDCHRNAYVKLVMLAIVDEMKQRGLNVAIGRKALAEKCDVSMDTVRRSMDEVSNLFEIEYRSGHANRYRPHMPIYLEDLNAAIATLKERHDKDATNMLSIGEAVSAILPSVVFESSTNDTQRSQHLPKANPALTAPGLEGVGAHSPLPPGAHSTGSRGGRCSQPYTHPALTALYPLTLAGKESSISTSDTQDLPISSQSETLAHNAPARDAPVRIPAHTGARDKNIYINNIHTQDRGCGGKEVLPFTSPQEEPSQADALHQKCLDISQDNQFQPKDADGIFWENGLLVAEGASWTMLCEKIGPKADPNQVLRYFSTKINQKLSGTALALKFFEKVQQNASRKKASEVDRGTRLTDNVETWRLPEAWRLRAEAYVNNTPIFASMSKAEKDTWVDQRAREFVRHFVNKTGKEGLRPRWDLTWDGWIERGAGFLEEKIKPNNSKAANSGYRDYDKEKKDHHLRAMLRSL